MTISVYTDQAKVVNLVFKDEAGNPIAAPPGGVLTFSPAFFSAVISPDGAQAIISVIPSSGGPGASATVTYTNPNVAGLEGTDTVIWLAPTPASVSFVDPVTGVVE